MNRADSTSYLKEIGRYATLPEEEQLKNLKSVYEMNLLIRQKEGKDLTLEEWALKVGLSVEELQKKINYGEACHKRLIQYNLKLVAKNCIKYLNLGLTLEDLIQEGAYGLKSALEKFNPELGYTFSTYATCWIKQSIRKALTQQGRLIRLPVHIYEKKRNIKRATQELIEKTGKKPKVEDIHNYLKEIGKPITIANIELVLSCSRDSKSLDEISTQEKLNMKPLNETVNDNLVSLEREFNKKIIEDALFELSHEERFIIESRYRLKENNEDGTLKVRTYLEVAEVLNKTFNNNITFEAVRQKEKETIKKLKRIMRAKNIDLSILIN